MIRNDWKVSASGLAISFLIFLNAIFLEAAYVTDTKYYQALFITVPLLIFFVWGHLKK
jgi:hypothetical protein